MKLTSNNQPPLGRFITATTKPQRRGKKRLGALKTLIHINRQKKPIEKVGGVHGNALV